MVDKKVNFYPSLFFQYQLCPDWIWHDLYSDPKEKGELPELTQKLFEKGILHEEKYVEGLEFETVEDKAIRPAFRRTIELMEKGAFLIYQGALYVEDEDIIYSGRPDFLQKKPGKSKFGDYYYAPLDIKSSIKIKKEQKMQLIFYGMILEKIQDVFPGEAGIINADHEQIFFKPREKDKAKTNLQIDKIVEIIRGKKPSMKLTSTFKQSPWFDKIFNEVKAKKDIALIYKLDSRALEKLREEGIKKVKDVAEMDIGNLPKIPYASPKTLERVKLQAQSLLEDEIKFIKQPEVPAGKPLKIFFDIEGDPLLNVQYLFGFWINGDLDFKYAKIGKVRKYKKEGKYFIYFLAEKPGDENKMWADFIKWVELLPKNQYTVYHFADYEKSRTRGLSESYGSSPEFEHFYGTYVDLAKIIQDTIIFPLYFYSIKDIAKSRFLDFKWRHAQAGGAQSIFWYEKWLETKDQQILEDIINYNEDDVRATEYLWEWLSDR